MLLFVNLLVYLTGPLLLSLQAASSERLFETVVLEVTLGILGIHSASVSVSQLLDLLITLGSIQPEMEIGGSEELDFC